MAEFKRAPQPAAEPEPSQSFDMHQVAEALSPYIPTILALGTGLVVGGVLLMLLRALLNALIRSIRRCRWTEIPMAPEAAHEDPIWQCTHCKAAVQTAGGRPRECHRKTMQKLQAQAKTA